jgi:hypothetical protein
MKEMEGLSGLRKTWGEAKGKAKKKVATTFFVAEMKIKRKKEEMRLFLPRGGRRRSHRDVQR